jgi:hypothetical protein
MNTFMPRYILIFLFLIHAVFVVGEDRLTATKGAPELVIQQTISIIAYPSLEKNAAGDPVSVVIPLKRVGRLFLIEAKIENETGNFVFDSGSSKFVLNRTYFRKYVTTGADEGGGVTGSFKGVGKIRVKKLEVSGLFFDGIMADVTDLGHIENRRGVKILGLFSLGLFKNMEMVIDLNKNELRLFRIDKGGNRIDPSGKPSLPDVKEKISEYRNIFFVKATIGGKVLNFCLDTGAESNVLSSYSPKKVMSAVTITRRSALTGSGSGGADVLYATINDFTFANRKINNMQTIITSLESMSEAYGVVIDGMLGYDFFIQGEVSINLVKNEIGIVFTKGGKQ